MFGKTGEVETISFPDGLTVSRPNYFSLAGFQIYRGMPRPGDAVVTINVAHEYDHGKTVDLGGKAYPDVERVSVVTAVHGNLRDLFTEFGPAIAAGSISVEEFASLQTDALRLDEQIVEICDRFLDLRKRAGLYSHPIPPLKTEKASYERGFA